MKFEQALEQGKTGESAIACYMRSKGYSILPVYEKLVDEYKGPTLFMSDGRQLVAPDMLVFNGKKTFWIEAKHKNAFSWHRISKQWTTGIDKHHYQQYLEVSKNSEWPVWLMFLHREGRAKDTPAGMIGPTGLFGEDIEILKHKVDHMHDNWGKHGMVYWGHGALKFICSLSALHESAA